MPLAPGTILGQYEILSPLGAGGMGEVYRARDTRLGRDVAVKVLPESVTTNPDRMRRFEQEARAAAALNHPNILAIYQMATQDGTSYLVSELLEGESLRDRLRRGLMPLRKAIDYAVQIAHGLAAPHEKGIVHRDLKPENVFITSQGRVKILDFGLAKVTERKVASDSDPTLPQGTEAGMVMGTAGYMSPEQVRGKALDHRSDIFSFGTILYELVTGKQSFHKSTSAETMTAILNEEPTPITQFAPATPPGVVRVVNRCLEKDPDQRFQSASDLAFALEALSDSGATPSNSAALPSPASPQKRWIWWGIASAAVFAVLVYLWMQPPPVPKLSNYTQLTRDGALKQLVGTDGSRIYYYQMNTEYVGLLELSVAGGESRKSNILPSHDLNPAALSPDNSEILASEAHGMPPSGPLWSFPILGGPGRRIGDIDATTASYSRDGKMIAFTKGPGVFVAQSDGSGVRQIADITPNQAYTPVFSPDGRFVRFDNSGPTSSFIWQASLDGRESHQLFPGLTQPPAIECCGIWSSDGKYFLYSSKGQIWSLPADSPFHRAQRLPNQLTSSPLAIRSFIPSKDGKKIFVVGENPRGQLLRYDLKTRKFEPYLGGISAEFMDFSKDKQWVAYVTFPENVLWRSRVDGSEKLQLTSSNAPAVFLPRWSPDGKTILYFSIGNGQHVTVYEIPFDGGNPRPVPIKGFDPWDPNWAPDGSKILFGGSASNPSGSIHLFDIASGQIDTLPGSTGFYSPRWSPDGRHIAAMSWDSTRLLVFDFDIQKWREVGRGNLGFNNWTSDSQSVVVLESGGTGSIRKFRISDGKEETVVELNGMAPTGIFFNQLALAPDDSPLYLHNVGTLDIYAIDWQLP